MASDASARLRWMGGGRAQRKKHLPWNVKSQDKHFSGTYPI